MSKRQRITIGSILEIKLDDSSYCYAQILNSEGCAFFDIKTTEPIMDFSILLSTPVLFRVAVYNDVITTGHWLKVGKMEIRQDLMDEPMSFIQDPINPKEFSLYNPTTGEITPATREECEGLECTAVWEAAHVESRLRDHYEGKPNVWVEQMRIK